MRLWIDRQGAVLRASRGRIHLEVEGQVEKTWPLEKVEEVVLVGGVQPSLNLLRVLGSRGVPLHFVSVSGRYRGAFFLPLDGQADLLKLQVWSTLDPIPMAKRIVEGKVRAMAALLKVWGKRVPEVRRGAGEVMAYLRKLPGAEDLESVRGIEGSATALYFKYFSAMVPPPFAFTLRTIRPPRDPVNALLSFGYTLLLTRVMTAVQMAGLHPALGYLHVSHGARPALALDLMEEFRSVFIDRLVVRTLRQGIINLGHFHTAKGGVYLNSEGRNAFLRHFTRSLSTEGEGFQERIFRYVGHFKGHLRGEPFPFLVGEAP